VEKEKSIMAARFKEKYLSEIRPAIAKYSRLLPPMFRMPER